MNRSSSMTNESSYQKMLREYLKDELRVLNAHLPGEQKPLSELLREEYPNVACKDGSTHLFKKKELKYLADMIDTDEQEALLLPMLIEVNPGQNEVAIICQGEVEKKVISKILNMPLNIRQNRITIYKPQ